MLIYTKLLLMKSIRKISFLFFLISAIAAANATKTAVVETKESINGMLQNCLVVEIRDVEPELVEKEWKNELKKYNGKVSEKKGTINAENVQIQVIHLNMMKAAAVILKTVDGSKFSVSFDLADNDFISSEKYPDKVEAAKKFLYDFSIRIRKTKVMTDLAESRNKLMELQKQHENLIKQKNDLQMDIQKSKELIVQKENEVKLNELNQENKQIEAENMKIVVEKIGKKYDAIE